MHLKASIRVFVTLLAICLISSGNMTAQNGTAHQVDEMLQVAVDQMNEGEYEAANLTFRKILKLNAVLPDELSYLFAETLYMVDQYHNSRSFVDKYIRLAGPAGRYYSQALDLKMYLDEEYELILICKQCDNRGYKLLPCDDCQGTGKVHSECFYCFGVGVNRCEICKGQGVTTSLNAFSETQYHTCSSCQGNGRIACKICHGEKEVFQNCPECFGTSNKAGTEICDHSRSDIESRMTVEQ